MEMKVKEGQILYQVLYTPDWIAAYEVIKLTPCMMWLKDTFTLDRILRTRYPTRQRYFYTKQEAYEDYINRQLQRVYYLLEETEYVANLNIPAALRKLKQLDHKKYTAVKKSIKDETEYIIRQLNYTQKSISTCTQV